MPYAITKKWQKLEMLLGKTRCINYFKAFNSNSTPFYIVDLPGYGYSKMSAEESKNIFSLTNKFLETNINLSHVFLILDIRHLPTKDDEAMYKWLLSKNIKFTIILNKADKLTLAKQQDAKNQIMKHLLASEDIITFSADKKQNIDSVINKIQDIII